MSNIMTINNMEDLNSALDAHTKILLGFYSEDSEESKAIDHQFNQFSKNPRCSAIKFIKINVNQLQEVQKRYEITTTPTVLALSNRDLIGQCEGIKELEGLPKLITQLELD
ncbi:hypothetical protein BX616_005680 [Lobosporangium transversale]|uniref:Thioredoxin domain-containing protein n=1 Tax=Lobosporangium transversale TaxID=64571 RepID=A0A1Y2GPI2_9FUNG|nr:hypothetical protein BCR41DRAFT_355778 [Lobosporangium transversale]KAF9915643.1 hypothetical protein BX616_005680 [Lobosporangium transversale]ORZ13442.1 hypothetical protein BCR41DRAFT_355778 [Lobosporangium transversale]|eukprot:XP_021880523.1 hypothetical protein BCR41DRAFT_355778 [Lobosporangium transversale]